jgi:beta-1,2-mannosidase
MRLILVWSSNIEKLFLKPVYADKKLFMRGFFGLTIITLLFALGFSCNNSESVQTSAPSTTWMMVPFVKADSINPILEPDTTRVFFCPIRKTPVKWEANNVLNPASIVKDGKVYLLYRAQDKVGILSGTSRLGLAVSDDGLHFTRHSEPVFYPDNDSMKLYEWEGGVEDPRLVETMDGRYILTYTAWDGKTARLCIASSKDLMKWEKHGLVLPSKYRNLWSKSGAIVCRQVGEKLVAEKINGRYWMYFGDTKIFICTSEDLVNWSPLENEKGELQVLFGPRKKKFDSDLVEPGPPPVITSKGILFVYNGRNYGPDKDSSLPDATYAAGQALMDLKDPSRLISRSDEYFFKPEKDYEIKGEVGNVCFLEGWVPFKGKWFMYYGTADSRIGVAVYQRD